MIKHFCNKCDVEFGKDTKKHPVRITVRGYGAYGYLECDYCEKCLKDILGADTFNGMVEGYAEHKRQCEQKRAERLAKANDE